MLTNNEKINSPTPLISDEQFNSLKWEYMSRSDFRSLTGTTVTACETKGTETLTLYFRDKDGRSFIVNTYIEYPSRGCYDNPQIVTKKAYIDSGVGMSNYDNNIYY